MNTLSYMGSLFFLFLLTLTFLKPTWCPALFCPVPRQTFVTHAQDVRDSNLEVYFTNVQSKTYVIPNDPTQYTLDTLPESIGVLHPNGPKSTSDYHLVLGLQNLERGQFGLTIEKVAFLVQQVFPIPRPINVWNPPSLISYENPNQYLAYYSGQSKGATLTASYLRFKDGFVHLTPKEADQIDLHVVSWVEANIHLSVQITYRNDDESQSHTLSLSQPFQIEFANSSEWHIYHLQDGHFVPNT